MVQYVNDSFKCKGKSWYGARVPPTSLTEEVGNLSDLKTNLSELLIVILGAIAFQTQYDGEIVNPL